MLKTSQDIVLHSSMAAVRSRAPFFVPLLVVALLMCHGALGNMDTLVLDPASSEAVHQLQSEADAAGPASGPADESPVEHPPAHGLYIVTFLTVLIGTFLVLLSSGIVPTQRIAVAPRRSQHDLISHRFYPGTSFAPALLQVFRL